MDIKSKEKKIIKGCRQGKAKYQQMLYELYYGKMLSICLRYAQNREEAKDILQEGYLKVFKNIVNFKGEGSLEGWVRRIMVNTCINHYHKSKKHQAQISIEDSYHELSENLENGEAIIQRMTYEDLLLMIRDLPPAYQTVFNLYVIEGYNHREISEMLQISEGTSKSNLAKARMKLQKQINESLGYKTYSRYA